MTLYYIEPVTVPDNNPHSFQININCEEISRLKDDFLLISYGLKINYKLNYEHKKYLRSKFFEKLIPFSVFQFIFKINKDFKFDKENDYLITRSPFIAWYFRNNFKKIILELHTLPHLSFGLIKYFLFDFILYKIPLVLIKNKQNIKLGVISNGLKLDLIKQGFNKKNIFIIPDGVYLEKFNLNVSKKEARKDLDLPQNKKIILYTGSLKDWKGIPTLLKASKNFDENTKFVIVGGKQTEIEFFSQFYPCVIFTGMIDNNLISKYLKAADILIIPNSAKQKISSHYTSPLKLFEYMASKRPIIASDLPSIREIVSNKEAVFFRPDDDKDLSRKIQILLKDKSKQYSISKNSYSKVKNYTWEKRVKNLIKYLN